MVFVLICSAFLWSQFIDYNHHQAKLVGIYGLAPIRVICPRDGQFSLGSSLDSLVQVDEVLASFKSEQFTLLKLRFQKEAARNIKEIKTRLIRVRLDLQEKTIQAQTIAKTKSAELWAYKGRRLKLEAQISALTQGIKGLKKAVKRGRAPLRDLVQVQADLKAAKVQVKPQKNQEFALQTLVQELEGDHSLIHENPVQAQGVKSDLSYQDLVGAHQDEIKAWQASVESLNQAISELEVIRAPTTGILIQQRSDISHKYPQSCLAGETIFSIQPVQTSLRLWQVDKLDNNLQQGREFELRIESEQLLTHPRLQVKITHRDQHLSLLPESLQVKANQALIQSALFGDLPKVYGIKFEAEIQDLNPIIIKTANGFDLPKNNLPWGLTFNTTWTSK